MKNRRNQEQDPAPFRGKKRKRGQRNAQHRARHVDTSSSCPGGLQGHGERKVTAKKPV